MAPKRRYRKTVKHYDIPGHAHFLTFSCYDRLPLLGKDRTCGLVIEAIEEARRKEAFDLWAWVIMPEHIHLLLWPRNVVYRTARILTALKRPVGIKAIAYLRTHAPRFLERLTVDDRGKVDVQGQSNNAARLIDGLQKSEVLTNPGFAGTIQSDPRTHKERFNLSFELRHGPRAAEHKDNKAPADKAGAKAEATHAPAA